MNISSYRHARYREESFALDVVGPTFELAATVTEFTGKGHEGFYGNLYAHQMSLQRYQFTVPQLTIATELATVYRVNSMGAISGQNNRPDAALEPLFFNLAGGWLNLA